MPGYRLGSVARRPLDVAEWSHHFKERMLLKGPNIETAARASEEDGGPERGET
jgi:hypothetical protein